MGGGEDEAAAVAAAAQRSTAERRHMVTGACRRRPAVGRWLCRSPALQVLPAPDGRWWVWRPWGCELASLRQGDVKAVLAYERPSTQGTANDALNDRALYRPEWFISCLSTHPLKSCPLQSHARHASTPRPSFQRGERKETMRGDRQRVYRSSRIASRK